MSENQKSAICLYVTLTFLLTGLTGVGMAIYIAVTGYDNVSHSTPIKFSESVMGYMHDHN